MTERFRPEESLPREPGFVPTSRMSMELLRELQKLSESRSNIPTSGFVPRNEQQTGFSQSRRQERTHPHATRYDNPIIDGLADIAKKSEPKKKTLWSRMNSRDKAGVVVATAATLTAGAIGLEHKFTQWQLGDLKPSKDSVIHLDDPSIPGHDSVVSTTLEPSVTVTSAPPGRASLKITVPQK